MRTADFHYPLPPELIAQHPAPRRDAARLLVLERCSGRLEHRRFPDLLAYLRAGDVLVLNHSRVIPAWLNELLARLEAPFERERRFSSEVAHELRTPVAESRSLAELAIKLPDTCAADADHETLAIALHLEAMLKHLLALARGERGESPRASATPSHPFVVNSCFRCRCRNIALHRWWLCIPCPWFRGDGVGGSARRGRAWCPRERPARGAR